MVQKFLLLIKKESTGIAQAAIVLGLFAFLSQILGFVRDRLLAHFIGPSATLDMYYAAFRIPDFLFVSIASLVSIVALVPFLSQFEKETVSEQHIKTKEFISHVFWGFLILLLVVGCLVFFLMPYIVQITAPGFLPEAKRTIVMLSRILLLSPLFLGLSNVLGSVSQSKKRFIAFSLSPIIYNVGIIVGIVFFYPTWGIVGLVFGVSLGALLHFLLQTFVVGHMGLLPVFKIPKLSVIKQVVTLSIPRTAGLALANLTTTALLAIASYLAEGSISIFSFAVILQAVPLSIIGVSFSVAAFPTLASCYAKNDIDGFLAHTTSAARQIIFWSLPAAALFVVLRAHIVRIILGTGRFTWIDTRLVAACLAVFVVSVAAQGLVLLYVRAFYAAQKTWRPLIANALASLFTIGSAFFCLHFMNTHPEIKTSIEMFLRIQSVPKTEVIALAFSFSLGACLNAFVLWILFESTFGSWKRGILLARTFLESGIGAVIVGTVTYGVLYLVAPYRDNTTLLGVVIQGGLAGFVGVSIGGMFLYLIGNIECLSFVQALHTRFWKKTVALPEQGDM